MEIILSIRARHGIIRGGTHFALPRDNHHPSGSGEQLCWVGGRGSAERRPKLTPRMPPISGARPRYPGSRSCRDAQRAGRDAQGAGRAADRNPLAPLLQGTADPGTAAPRPCSHRALPALGRARRALAARCKERLARRGFAAKCHLLAEFGWPLSQPVPRQGRDAGTRPCHIGDTRLRLSPSAAGTGTAGLRNSLRNGKSGISHPARI